MKRYIKRLKWCLIFLAFGIFITGCASSPKKKAVDIEKHLTSAGFKKMVADSQEKLDHLKTLPQRKFFKKEKDGNLYYVWADQKSCNCLYYGDKNAYEIYQQILLTLKLERDTAGSKEWAGTTGNWGMWGTWTGPFRY